MTFTLLLQSFFKHLEELRSRFIKSVGAFVLAFFACYNFTGKLIPKIVAPAGHLVFTAPGEAFGAYMLLTAVMAMIIASPYIAYQIWAFIGTALKPSEKKFVFIFGPLSLFFFLSGCAFAYFVTVPMVYHFFMSFSSAYLVPMVSVNHYLGFMGHMMLAFGIAFELPLILAFLAKIGVASPAYLRHMRRHAIMIILIVSALVMPPDIASMLILAVPLILLYELGIFFVGFFYNQQGSSAGSV